jgi:sulfide:quinone oxidoreductase
MAAEPQTIVVVGGGVAGLELALALDEHADDHVAVTLIETAERYVERAWLVAEAVTGATPDGTAVEEILAETSVNVIRDVVTSVDPAGKAVRLSSGRDVHYDTLVIATGTVAAPVPDGAIALDPHRPENLRRLREEVASGAIHSVAIVIEPGRHWTLPAYELAFALADVGHSSGHAPEISVVAPEPQPLAIFGHQAHVLLRERLDEAGIRLVAGVAGVVETGPPPAIDVHPGRERLVADRIVCLPVLRPRLLPGLATRRDEFLAIGPDGSVAGRDDMYAIGDVTDGPIKLGAIAAQQAEATARAIAVRAGMDVQTLREPLVPRGVLLIGQDTWHLQRNDHDESSSARQRPDRPAIKVLAPRLKRRLEQLQDRGSHPRAEGATG